MLREYRFLHWQLLFFSLLWWIAYAFHAYDTGLSMWGSLTSLLVWIANAILLIGNEIEIRKERQLPVSPDEKRKNEDI